MRLHKQVSSSRRRIFKHPLRSLFFILKATGAVEGFWMRARHDQSCAFSKANLLLVCDVDRSVWEGVGETSVFIL